MADRNVEAVAQRLEQLLMSRPPPSFLDKPGKGRRRKSERDLGMELLGLLNGGREPRLAATEDGVTLVHYACQHGWMEFVDFLILTHDCDAHAKTLDGQAPLHYACQYGQLDLVYHLISEHDCNPDRCNIYQQTPLHLVCSAGRSSLFKQESLLQTVKFLVSKSDISKTDDRGNTALHVACYRKEGNIVSTYLLQETRINPNAKNNYGETALYLACRSDNFTLVQALVRDERCNVHEKNNDGETVLHAACRVYQPNCIPKFLLEEAKLDPNAKSNDGDTPLHVACTNSRNVELVQLLVRDERCNPHERNGNGNTALHVACRCNRSDKVAKLLLDEVKLDPSAENNDGDTPLHLACRNTYMDVALVQVLVRDPPENNSPDNAALHTAGRKVDPNAKNSNGETPLDLTSAPAIIRELIRHGANPRDVYETHGKIIGKRSSMPLQTPVKLFVLGNPSAGKSTLTKALKSELTQLVRLFKRSKPVSGVDEKTAGIVPHEFESKIYGRVTLYDFAGQREFYGSHAALLQNAIQTSTPIFLLVVDLSKNVEDTKQNILYWLSFLENQCTSVSSKPHLVVIGSHADILKSRGEDPKHKGSLLTAQTIPQFASLEFTGFIAMDCQYADSSGMRKLHQILKTSCESLRSQVRVKFNAHCFLVYLLDKFGEATALTLATIQAQIKQEFDQAQATADDVKCFVPSNIVALYDICDELNDRGHLLVLKNPTAVEKTWVIINRTALLTEVNGTIFAPEGFKEHINLASSTGVVALSNIAKHFPKHDLTMLVGFLSHLEFCHEISDNEILALISQEQASTTSEATAVQGERYFFLPGLVTLEVPSTVWEPQPQFGYHCGWILQFCILGQFFCPRFVQVLLLRLAFSLAFRKPSSTDIPSLQRKCSIWKNGIYWGDRYGTETLVEIAEQNRVVILMRCPEVKTECLQLRSLLIQKVLAAAREFCSKMSTMESFINPSDTTQYPLKPISQLTFYDITEVATAVATGVPSVVHDTGTPVSLDSLLSFEPYTDLEEVILRELFNEEHPKYREELSDVFISNIAERIAKRKEVFKALFKPKAAQLAMRMSKAAIVSDECEITQILNMWKDQTDGTYQCLREKLDQLSVFAGRNPLEIAGISYESNSQSTDSCDGITPETGTAIHMEYVVSPADVDMLAELLSEVAAHWDLFLGQLGLPQHVQDVIRYDNARFPKFCQRCLLEGFRCWVESED